MPNRLRRRGPSLRWTLILVMTLLVARPAAAVPGCIVYFMSFFSPYYRAMRAQAETAGRKADFGPGLKQLVRDLGGKFEPDEFKPPELEEMRLLQTAADALKAKGVTPESRLRQFAAAHPKYAPVVQRLLKQASDQGVALRWDAHATDRGPQDIRLGVDRIGQEHPELVLLTTLAHELSHRFYTARPEPSDTRETFLARWERLLFEDEMAAIVTGIETALALEAAGGVPAEKLVSGASRAVLALRRRPFSSPVKQAEAEKQALLLFEGGVYPKLWRNYLEQEWENRLHSPQPR